MPTYMPKPCEISRLWYVIDGAGLPLGRVAAQVASILRGKIKAIFVPHVDCGDHVIVINCDKIILTGRKLEKKVRYRHTGYIGHLKKINYSDLMKNKPNLAMELAVKGMLPKNTLGRKQLTRLTAVVGENHNHAAQKPQVWNYFRKVRVSA
ncbi:MAG: 50S ribosomal protein L13 [Candidatus Improbicoccus devescovinae]|nr:MAG: 50S ribosomal protein L13 [Candidatus Improbicoccus devescovinae]